MKPTRPSRSPRQNMSRLLLVLSSFVFPHSSFAVESPLYIPFQGQVTNQAGVLSADGQYSVIFNLYDQAVGGQPVWSERHVKIGVARGMINVFQRLQRFRLQPGWNLCTLPPQPPKLSGPVSPARSQSVRMRIWKSEMTKSGSMTDLEMNSTKATSSRPPPWMKRPPA